MAAAAAACLALLLLPCAAALPSGPSSARPDAAGSVGKKPLRRGDSPRTTADSEPHQHFQAPANSHLPAQMDFAEF
eukprot:COSAG04_NODE_7772_length_1069_cov_4.779381_2_plen_75_part_01